ncbi:MAG: YcaO-like family protein [Pseudomonadota bacterium]
MRGNTVLFPVNLIGNLYISNGMSAGNTMMEARTQALAEIFERNIKYKIIREGVCLPDVPESVLNRYPRIAPGFDMDEITDSQNLEIHFVDSSGVISWDFLRSTPDYEFVDWNFGGSSLTKSATEEDYNWCVNTIHNSGHDMYIADFTHLGVYACRIFVPGMSEIYPVEELQWENNTVGNLVRHFALRLPELNQAESAELLETLLGLELADELLVTTLIGLCADPNTTWVDLRAGEFKALAALAAGDTDEILNGCAWIAQCWRITRKTRPRLPLH